MQKKAPLPRPRQAHQSVFRRGRFAGLALLATAVAAVAGAQKPTVPVEDYGKFERLGWRQALAADGSWVAYEINRVDRTHELRARPVAVGAKTRVFENGRAPIFSADARHLAWRIELPQVEKERLEDAADGRPGLGLLRLAGEQVRTIDEVDSFAFDESGRYLAVLGFAPKTPKGKGADLRVLDLAAGSETTFGNVSSMAWSEKGSLLALVTATGRDAGNGLQLLDAATGLLRGLDASGSRYLSPTWRDGATDLAVLRTLEPATTEEARAAEVLAWRNLDSSTPRRLDLSAEAAPEGLEIVVHREPTWAEVGARVAIGLRPCSDDGCVRDTLEAQSVEGADQAKEEEQGPGDESSEQTGSADSVARADSGSQADSTADSASETEPELPGLQIWHAKDRRLFPEQQVNAQRDERRTLTAVWHLEDDSLVQLGTDLMARVELLGRAWHGALESTDAAYDFGVMFGRPYVDVFRVDVRSGARKLLAGKVRYRETSPDGRWLLTFDGRDWWAEEIASGDRRNLTERFDVDFAQTDYDTPTDLLPPHGDGGWLAEDAGVLLYDEFDVWLVDPADGRGRRLTDGRPTQLIYRIADLAPDEEAHDPNDGLLFLLRNEKTEQRGLARLPDVSSGQAEIRQIGDVHIGSLDKARDEETLVYVRQSRTESPNLFLTDTAGAAPRQLSQTNPFLDDYAWTRSELVDFTSEQGRDLQATLLYPANHDPTRRYPMIVYTYEILAPQIHTFDVPDERRYYNYTAWTQAGYFVLMPDIVYTAREPGPSALASVRAAVKTVADRGLVDPERVGLIGHSWGGYQATYLPTRTHLFAASVAGAPLTDFVSFMGQLHWNPGIAEVSHWETGQARMEVPFWEDPDAHRRSSPIHEVHNMETPLLMAFGNEDGVVDWDQGTEFFNFARRAQKQMVLLVYEGEDHGFREEANQKDYHRRILEWFGHYLKGEDAPRWITEGIALDELEEEKERVAKGR
ncbi:MAG: YqiA/YcfP family alpha/beta fold hydrolase [Acidobacteriota bacterium]